MAISGTGAVGHAAVMAARVSGCTTIIAIDQHENRVALAQKVGATHAIHGRAEEAQDELLRLTGGRGVDYIEARAACAGSARGARRAGGSLPICLRARSEGAQT